MRPFKKLILCILIVFTTMNITLLFAQKPVSKDSLMQIKISQHSPKKATLYSTIMPGLGQVYNKKYWKVPIIYGGFGALTYSYLFADKKYTEYLHEFNYRLNKDSIHYNADFAKNSDENILELKNYYQRNRELSIIGFVVLYALNIIDATVDGHLYSFDISDNLSLNTTPYLAPVQNNKIYGGIQFTFSPNWSKKNSIRYIK